MEFKYLSPDLSRREKGPKVVWSHPQDKGDDDGVDAGNDLIQQGQEQLHNQYGQGQYETLPHRSHVNNKIDVKALEFLKNEMAKLEDEKMSLLEAEKFAHENPPHLLLKSRMPFS